MKSEFGESDLQGAQQVGPLEHLGVEAPVQAFGAAVGHQSDLMRCRTRFGCAVDF